MCETDTRETKIKDMASTKACMVHSCGCTGYAHIMYENMDACTQRTKLRCCPAAIGTHGAGSESSIPSRSLHGLDGGWKWRDEKKMITSNSDCRVLHNKQNRYGTDVCYANCYRPWALRVDDMTRHPRIAHEHSAFHERSRPRALDDDPVGLRRVLDGRCGGLTRRRWLGGSPATVRTNLARRRRTTKQNTLEYN